MKRGSHFWVSNCSSKGKEKKYKRNQDMDIISMEPICMDIIIWNTSMELMYENFVRKLSQIPPCLSLCRKNLNKGGFGWFKSSFEG